MKRRASTISTSGDSSASAVDDLPISTDPTLVATETVTLEVEEEEPFDPPPELVSAYESLMKERVDLADITPIPAPDVSSTSVAAVGPVTPATAATTDADADAAAEAALGRPMTKAEKQNAKKKRRKERERAMKAALEAAAKPEAPPLPKNDIVREYASPSPPSGPFTSATQSGLS